MRAFIWLAALAVLGPAVPARAQQIQLQFDAGAVTLKAVDAPLRAILVEWSRQGGTHIFDGRSLPETPVTLVLTRVPERKALDVLLRNVAGYTIGLRAAATRIRPGQSIFDRIHVLPAAAAVPAARQLQSTRGAQVVPVDPNFPESGSRLVGPVSSEATTGATVAPPRLQTARVPDGGTAVASPAPPRLRSPVSASPPNSTGTDPEPPRLR